MELQYTTIPLRSFYQKYTRGAAESSVTSIGGLQYAGQSMVQVVPAYTTDLNKFVIWEMLLAQNLCQVPLAV